VREESARDESGPALGAAAVWATATVDAEMIPMAEVNRRKEQVVDARLSIGFV
jgi:hypothetical protein